MQDNFLPLFARACIKHGFWKEVELSSSISGGDPISQNISIACKATSFHWIRLFLRVFLDIVPREMLIGHVLKWMGAQSLATLVSHTPSIFGALFLACWPKLYRHMHSVILSLCKLVCESMLNVGAGNRMNG